MAAAFQKDRRLQTQLPEDGKQILAEGYAVGLEEKETWHVITLKTENLGKILVYAEKEEETEEMPFSIGERLQAAGQVSRFEAAGNPGQFDLGRYYRSKGISLSLFADRVRKTGEGNWPYLDGLFWIRRRLSSVLEEICDPEDLGIFQAAILGEKGGMDEKIQDLYQKSGIAHLLAISGLHLSLMGAGFYRILRRAGLGFGAAGAAGCAAVISYGIMTGASGSAVRAVIMLSVSFLASYLGRTYDLLSALSLAAVLLSGSNPFVIGESGFQLSFGAVLGIGFVGEILKKGLEPKGGFQESLLTSVGIQLVTGPIVLWHYYQYPLYGIVLNLLVVPLMGYVIISGLLGMGAGLFSVSLGRAALGSGHYILLLYQCLCIFFLDLPGSQLIMGRPQPVRLLWYGAAVAGFLCWIRYGGKRMHNSAGKHKESEKNNEGIKGEFLTRWVIFLFGSAACFFLLMPERQEGMVLCFMDVGQGDGAVIRTEKGAICFSGLSGLNPQENSSGRNEEFCRPLDSRGITVLADSGSTSDKNAGENRLAPYLKYHGIGAVDIIMVSHGDADHISGLLYLLEECKEIAAGCLVLPEAGRGDAAYEELIRAAGERKMAVRYMDAGDQIQAGDLFLTCLYPGKGEELQNPDRNRQSLVVKGDYQGFHFLLTGDTSQECELRILERTDEKLLDEVQVLKAAHHGSRYSNSQEFLDAVSPAVTVISYGEGNRYGHPHGETEERIRQSGSRILKTGELGAVTFYVGKGKAGYQVYRKNPP